MHLLRALLLSFAILIAAPARAEPARIFAAASLTDAMTAAGDLYARSGRERPVFAFAASSTLARQIEQGARADLFVSADEDWMDYLAERRLIDPASRRSLFSNTLVLIAPADRPFTLAIRPGFDLAGALRGGRLAVADPETVPAGRYARAALTHFGAWEGVSQSLARAENVRTALRYVELGEAAAGIVYRTDALAAGARVVVVGSFPASSHPPIVYPAAIVREGAGAEAAAFLAFLHTPPARAVFERMGFLPVP
jgi:molybdate transport system substrate-binding protein